MKTIKMIETQTKKGAKIELSVDEYRHLRISVMGLVEVQEIHQIKNNKLDAGIVEDEKGKFRALIPMNEDMKKFVEWWEQEKIEWEEAKVEVFVPGDGEYSVDSRKTVEEILKEEAKYIEYLDKKVGNGRKLFEEAIRKHLGWAEQKKQAEKEEKQEYEERFQKCLLEAQRTGSKVQLDRYTEDCDDPREECSTDIITVYITPEGKIKEERSHTF
jgi:hypothetical protein